MQVKKGNDVLMAIKQKGDTLQECTTKFAKAMANIFHIEPQEVMNVFLSRLRKNSLLAMDLNMNDVYTVTQLLKRTNKFIVVKENENIKDGDYDPNTRGSTSSSAGELMGRKFEEECSKWVPNKVYQASTNPLNNFLDTKNGPYRY